MSVGKELWAASKLMVSRQLQSAQHAITSTVKTMARDAKARAPRAMATSVGALVPFPVVGSALNAAIALALQKYNESMTKVRQQAGAQALAASPDDFQAIKTAAGADLQHAVNVLGKLVDNQDKMTACTQKAAAYISAFESRAKGAPTYDDIYGAGWNIACSLHELHHYEAKCLNMIEVLRLRLTVAEAYINACSMMRRSARKAVIENVDRFLDPDPGLLAMGQDSPPAPSTKRLFSGLRSDDFD